ncbi:TIGR03086 family protein [Nocardioides humilatus]|uniref:TIGR03086 family protein n=1 Tax=Nocardioides humilatus TaxID=2607660 RepID=A0A5B1LEC9_9ACTN|nr:maleylpyruvate isomerase N-terminal domain-containing protein [Nocardioides humilatus]KAA1418806.1 TIGR03086 family protein [Nocardioides humilatus]
MASSSGLTGSTDAVRVLAHALDQAGDVLDHVHAGILERPTPCSDWDVAALAGHLVQAPANFLAMMRGEQPDFSAVAEIDEGWGGVFRVHADDLIHAWHELSEEPPVPAEWQVAELAVHAWDLAVALDFPLDRLDPEVAQLGHGFMQASLTPDRRGDVFAPEVEAPADGGVYGALAAFAGRQL